MKLILVGKGASGKDHLKKRLVSQGFSSGVSCTTRPPRNGEEEGVDYYFMTRDKFNSIIESGDMLEYMEFNGWLYGLTISEFEQSDVMIMSKDGLDMLPSEYRKRCVVIYLDVDRLTRVERLNARKDVNDSIIRRLKADEKQFSNFEDYDIRIKNNDF